MNHIRYQLSMCNAITAQLVSDDLPGFTPMGPEQALEESLRRASITLCLEIDINKFAILVMTQLKLHTHAANL